MNASRRGFGWLAYCEGEEGALAVTDHAKAVARAARKAASARQELEQAVRAARASGMTLRAVSDAAGVSYETVRRIAG